MAPEQLYVVHIVTPIKHDKVGVGRSSEPKMVDGNGIPARIRCAIDLDHGVSEHAATRAIVVTVNAAVLLAPDDHLKVDVLDRLRHLKAKALVGEA